MNPTELRKAQWQILDHITDAGSLSDIASVLIKFVYHLSPDCYFEPLKGTVSEWILRPKNWIGLYLSTGRSGRRPKIIVSIDLWPQNVPADIKIPIRQGRLPQWSKFTVSDIAQLRDALALVAYAKR
jgi:hypothetical protein